MYNTQNITIYYLRDYFTNEDRLIGNFDELIDFLANSCRINEWNNNLISSKYFEEINCTTNDFTHSIHMTEVKNGDEYSRTYTDVYTIKQFLFYDNNYRIIDVREYKELVFKRFKINLNNYNYKKRKDNFQTGETYLRNSWYCKKPYKFRRGPVPGIHKRKYGHYYKHPRIKQKLILASIPEYKEYIRPKEYETKSYWCDDYGPRHFDKSWKTNKKVKHQWQKNLK